MRKQTVIFAIAFAALLLAACGTSTGALHKIQLHTPLSCPCPTIAPLAQYPLPAEVACCSGTGAYLGWMTVGPDGNIWVPEFDADKIARVTTGGTVTEFQIPTANAAPWYVAAGPDGNLWFAESNFNTIGRITTSGVITEFPLPPPLDTAPPSLGGITRGPDGNLWFMHGGANLIGVMSTSGTLLATYQLPSPNPVDQFGGGQAVFIITGPDNNLWFVEEGANKIGRITTSGVIAEFSVPTTNSHPKNLIIGSDGNLWFPEIEGGNVGRITMTGAITEFPMVADPTIHRLRRIAVLPDGSMWLTEAMVAPPWDSEIGKFDITGTETDLWSVGGQPRAIIGGPDGNPWFADDAKELVVRL